MWKKFSQIVDMMMWFVLPFNAIAALGMAHYGECLAWSFAFILHAEVWGLKKQLSGQTDRRMSADKIALLLYMSGSVCFLAGSLVMWFK